MLTLDDKSKKKIQNKGSGLGMFKANAFKILKTYFIKTIKKYRKIMG
jgi:hypothetical protein